MIYYDIHTHKLPEAYDENVVSIFNLYPLDYDKYKNIENPNLYFSAGIHPWYLDDVEKQLDALRRIVYDERIVAIGEAGLDKLCSTDWDLQQEVFRNQIEIAIETEKPLIIHCVKAWDELIALFKEYNPINNWIIHGFRGKWQQAKQLTDLGMKLSFGEKFNKEALECITFESVFFETDDSDKPIVSICQDNLSNCGLLSTCGLSLMADNVVKTFRL